MFRLVVESFVKYINYFACLYFSFYNIKFNVALQQY